MHWAVKKKKKKLIGINTEKWKWKSLSRVQLFVTPSVHGILQARILEWVAFPFTRGSSQPRDQTQGSNPGLAHCRRILYQLSHKGSPNIWEENNKIMILLFENNMIMYSENS